MQAEIGRGNLETQGDLELGSWLAKVSIRPADDGESLSHQIASFRTSFRQSVMASGARSTRRAESREH